MLTCDILLRAKYIVTQNTNREVLSDAYIAIDNNTICAMGLWDENCPWQGKVVRNFENGMILPGLINAHTHTAMTFLRGFADDLPVLTWLTQKIFPIEAKLTKDIVYTFSLLGFAEMLATGTTSCLDMYIFGEETANAAECAGIGLGFGEAVFTFPTACASSWHKALEITESLHERFKYSSRINVFINPHSVYTTNSEILNSCEMLADKLDIPIHIHLSESEAEVAECQDFFNKRPIIYAKEQGLFDFPCSLAHVVIANDEELELLEMAKDSVIVHNPTSNMKLCSGVARIPEILDHGIPVALGTDGPASNNSLNMFAEMKTCSLIHKIAQNDYETMKAQQTLDLATLGGARALHRSDIGNLSIGKRADLVVLDLTRPNLQPVYSPVSQIVYAASGQEVILTMVDGEILYDSGHFTRFSYSDLLIEVRKIRDYIVKTYSN